MILLITENETISSSFKKDLEQEGFKVTCCTDFNQALFNLYQSTKYSMIIVDLAVSNKEIQHICQKLKSYPGSKHIPLICIVDKEKVIDQLVAFEMGADEFIYFPYTTPELQLKIRSLKRLMELQNQLEAKENQLKALNQLQKIMVTLNHHINNSLTPLYGTVQMVDNHGFDDISRMQETAVRTVEFIQKVLRTLDNLIKTGELKVVKEGVYKGLILDIETELKKLQET